MMGERTLPHNPGLFGNGVFCTVNELFYEGQKSRHANLHLRRKSSAHYFGGKRSSVRGRGMEFFESRPYVAQDEMRSIDWKVSARLNGLHTKIFVEERDRPIFIAVDQRSPMFFGSVNCFKSVLAARLAARLATAAINSGDNFLGIVFDDDGEYVSPMSRSQKNLARFFGLLATASQNYERDPRFVDEKWSMVLNRMANRIHAGSVIFLISDFFGLSDDDRHLLFKLRKRADVFALSVYDPLEEHLPHLGCVGMAFGNDEVIFDSSSKSLEKKYAAWYQAQKSQREAFFSSMDIPEISFSTAADLDVSLRRLFLGRW